MNNEEYYMALPFDVSGSRSKNRFKLELLWGVSKTLDIYDTTDFIVVFDYVCDIEIHTENTFEFYQIKTHKGEKTYSETDIIKQKKGHSILGKLYILKDENHPDIKLAIVSNAYFKDDKKVTIDVEELELSGISENSQKTICASLKSELGLESINLNNVFFINTSMNLNEPQNDIAGKIVTSFIKIKGCEPKKPNDLYRLIFDTVSGKACCELVQPSYSQLLCQKGLTKAEFDGLLNCHLDIADNSVELTKEYINRGFNYKERRNQKAALANLYKNLQISEELKNKEIEIANYVIENHQDLPNSFEDCVDYLIDRFSSTFSIEYSALEIYILIVLILKRFEEGVYDE